MGIGWRIGVGLSILEYYQIFLYFSGETDIGKPICREYIVPVDNFEVKDHREYIVPVDNFNLEIGSQGLRDHPSTTGDRRNPAPPPSI